VTAYYSVEEGQPYSHGPRSRAIKQNSPLVILTTEHAPSAADLTLSRAILLIKIDNRTDKKANKWPTICFLSLKNPALTIRERVALYATLGSLTRHFNRKHVSKLKE
jgi:hypothetical protein